MVYLENIFLSTRGIPLQNSNRNINLKFFKITAIEHLKPDARKSVLEFAIKEKPTGGRLIRRLKIT